jgi:hypothetical protein
LFIVFKHFFMKKVLIHYCILFFLFQLSASAQKTVDEEKVKKAVVLMQKMMTSPGEVQNTITELQALKLTSAENKEAKTRMQQQAVSNAAKIKEEVMSKGGITQKQITTYQENKDRIVPERDDTRINAVLKRDLSDAEIKNYCKAVFDAVKKELNPAAVSQAEKIYAKLKAKQSSTVAMGNGAISCYLSNLTQQSIYIMGKVCSDDASNANNLNNYAALLTNHGVEQGAIPILNYLNKKYARSPVVMSNLSVAWMGLGEMKTAEQYADSCIRFFPGNAAQAHYVKAVVKESENNREAAITELKQSIGENYSAEKESLLRKMGGKLKAADHKKKLPADALGLSKFVYPELPMDYESAINSTQEWQTFYKNTDAAIQELQVKTNRLKKTYEEKVAADTKAAATAIKQKNGRLIYAFAANNNSNQSWNNFYQLLSEEFVKKEELFFKELNRLEKINAQSKEAMEAACDAVSKKYENFCGEGQKCPEAEICNAYLTQYNIYMLQMNKLYQKYFSDYIEHKRKMTNELVYAGKQSMDAAYYEYFASESKLQFLYTVKSVHFKTPNITPVLGGFKQYCINVKTNPFTNKGLAKWEEVHCQPDWKVNLGTAGLATHCNKITLTADILIGEASYSADVVTGEWTNFTLEIGREIGSREVGAVEVSAGGKAFIEIDRRGISDFGVKGTAGVSAGATNAELEGKLSLMSGKASFETKGGTAIDKVVVLFK